LGASAIIGMMLHATTQLCQNEIAEAEAALRRAA
jgi:hypothetical protein